MSKGTPEGDRAGSRTGLSRLADGVVADASKHLHAAVGIGDDLGIPLVGGAGVGEGVRLAIDTHAVPRVANNRGRRLGDPGVVLQHVLGERHGVFLDAGEVGLLGDHVADVLLRIGRNDL